MSDHDASSSRTLKPPRVLLQSTAALPSARGPDSSSLRGQVSNSGCCSSTGSQLPSFPSASSFPTKLQHEPTNTTTTTNNNNNNSHTPTPNRFQAFPSRPSLSPIQSLPSKRSATTHPTLGPSFHSNHPAPLQSISYSADSPPTFSLHPPPLPHPQQQLPPTHPCFSSQPFLEPYLFNSPQLVFVIPAHPLHGALCKRRRVGMAEDPDEHAQFPIYDGATPNFSSQSSHAQIVYPHLSPDEADWGRDLNLSELVSPIYVNPAAEEFARLILERTKQPIGKQPLDSSKGWYWDIMKLLHHQDLSRWLSWLRGILEKKTDSPSSFKTSLKTSDHFTAPTPSNHPRKRHIPEPPSSHSTNESSARSPVSPPAPEIIMTAQLFNSDHAGHSMSVSDEAITTSHHIIFSAIVLRHPTQPDHTGPARETAHQTSNFQTPHQQSSLLPSTSQLDKLDGFLYSDDPDNHICKPPSSEAIRPKRIKTSQQTGYFPPSTTGASYTVSPTNTSQDSFATALAQQIPIPPKLNWLDENNAKRLFLKSSRRSNRLSGGRGLAFPNPNLSVPLNSRRSSGPGRSGLSHASQEGTDFPASSSESRHSPTDKMVLDDPWFRELSDANLDTYSTSQNTDSGPHSHPTASLRHSHSEPLDELQSNGDLCSIQEEYDNDDCMSEILPGPSKSRSKSVTSSAQSCRSDSYSSSSSLSTCHPREAGDDLFRQALMASSTGQLILELDWQNTPIGPIDGWSPTLKSMVTLILASPYRMSLLWGEECVMLYNDAYVRTCGLKHPSLLGQSGALGWAELWADLGDIADSVLQGGVYTVYDSLMFFDRDPDNPNGIKKEESYHSFSWIPVRGPTGNVEGILNPSFETTLRVIAERRLGSLRDLVQITLMSRNRVSYEERCLESFAKNPYDLPFVIMYSCETKKSPRRGPPSTDESVSEASTGSWINLQLRLAGTIGVPKGHPSAAEKIQFNVQIHGSSSQSGGSCHSPSTLGNSAEQKSSSQSSVGSQRTMLTEVTDDDNVVWPLREACTFRKPIYIAHLGDRAKGLEIRGWPDRTKSAVVMPVSNSEDSAPLGVIVFGLSPRLNWTESYALFLNLLTRQFSTGLSTVIGHEEEAQRLEDLAALDRAKTTFFTNISHELRTPLTLIVGPISMILESSDISAAARERLKVVERNTQRLINLVNQLLDLSRFEAGKMVARFRGTDVSKLTANLAALFRSAMHKKQISFIVDCPDTTCRVWVDHDFFEKVVFNILSNSMKFTPQGGKVTLEVQYDSNNCYLICSDTGRGIKSEELPRIFERFHRAEDPQMAEGTGIGLALVQDIVKLHGGTLDVESEVNRGSKFTITFRLGVTHLPPDSLDLSTESEIDQFNDRMIASNARRWILGETEPIRSLLVDQSPGHSDSSSRGSADLPMASMNEGVLSTTGSTVLIADDNSDMRAFLKSVLSRYYNVVEAVDGYEALQRAKLNRPDILVSDVMMPGMDGFELIRRLKADSDTAAMSVILLSARAGSESRVEGLAKGADDYLVKPFEAKELVARVNTHLQIAKMRQRLEGAVATRTQLLRENEQKYRDLYHTFEVISMLCPVGIFQLSPSGQITFANNAFRSQCKLNPGEPLSLWMSCIHSLDSKEIEAMFDQSIRARQPIKGEFRWRDGSWCFYELTPYYKEDDLYEGYLGSTTDVTERKESEQKQLEAAEARARDAEESKRQQEAFIDMTSHEIRNPLHGIHQAADLLYSSLKFLYGLVENSHQISGPDLVQFRDELREDIDAIESIQLCASHQSRIADDIINVSKLSMGLLTTIKTDFDLVGRVREVLSMYLIEAQQKSVELKLQIGEGLDTNHYICADPNRLAQVIINFLSNALRYTSNSDGPKSVTVRVDVFAKCPEPRPNVRRIGSLKAEAEAVEPSELVFAKVGVQDTARGLSPEELSKLFSRFVQANPTQDQYGGSGLGLYVSHRLIENHGGFIEVESTKGHGSVFSFVIPTQRSVRPPSTNSASYSPCGLRGFTRAINEEEVVEMQPASALLPGGTIAAGGAMSSRLPSPDIHPSPGCDHHTPPPERFSPQQPKDENLMMSASSESSSSIAAIERRHTGSPQTHVLVVEDNTINVKVIKRQLTQKGYLVSVAMDGREALNRLYADASESSGLPSIDIVLMDIQMPVMNGLEAITHLRAAEKNGEIKKRYPVIAVTGNARKEQTEQCLASGFDSICVKPYKINEVQSRMEALLANLVLDDN